MSRTDVDAFGHRRGFHFLGKDGQPGEPGSLPSQRFKFLLLTRCLAFGPSLDRVARDRFDPADAGRDRGFVQDAEMPDIAGRADVRAAAKLHGVSVESVRRAADLHDAYAVAVFVAEEL